MSTPDGPGPLQRLDHLPDRGKEPNSARTLDAWIIQAQERVGVDHGRLGWLIASTVVVAALQRAVDESDAPRFLLKGGTYLQHRLDWAGRSTKDVDGIVRGDIDGFLDALDRSLREPWGPLRLSRTETEVIQTPTRVLRPRRFDVKVSLRGVVWRRIKVEISPDEAGIGDHPYPFATPSLSHLGLPALTSLSESRCASRSPKSSTPAPIHTIRRTLSTTALVTSSTCSSYATSWPPISSPPTQTCVQHARRSLTPAPPTPSNSDSFHATGRQSCSRTLTGWTTTPVPPVMRALMPP